MQTTSTFSLADLVALSMKHREEKAAQAKLTTGDLDKIGK